MARTSLDTLPPTLPVDGQTRLERLGEKHADPLLNVWIANRQHLVRGNIEVPEPLEPSRVKSRIVQKQLYADEGLAAPYVIEHRGDIVGEAGFYDRDGHEARIRYWLDRSLWGRKIARGAAKTLLDFGFGEWNLNRVLADVVPGNKRSKGLARSLGFQLNTEESWEMRREQ